MVASLFLLSMCALFVSVQADCFFFMIILIITFIIIFIIIICYATFEKGKSKVQRVPQSQTAALPRHQEEEETDKTKQVQIEQTYEKY